MPKVGCVTNGTNKDKYSTTEQSADWGDRCREHDYAGGAHGWNQGVDAGVRRFAVEINYTVGYK